MYINDFQELNEGKKCNMTEEGRSCPSHGLNECPGYKMLENSVQDKLYQRHQELRKKSGLPDPKYYQELKATFDLPDEERHRAVTALKKKYKIKEEAPTGHGQISTKYGADGTKVSFDPATGGKTVSGATGTTSYNVAGQKTAYQTPTIGGISRTTNYQTGEKTTAGQVGDLSVSSTQRPDQSTVTTAQAPLGSGVTASVSQGIGFGGAGKNVQQGGNQVSTISTPQGTQSFTGKPTQQDVEKTIPQQPVDEAGPFSYGAKKPRKGSVADLAAKKRKEQEKDKQPAEPKDHMVGVARVVKEFAPSGGGGGRWYSDDQLYDIIGEDWLEAFDVSGDQGNIDLRGERARLFLAQEAEAWLTDRGYRVNVLDVRDDGDELSWYIQGALYRGLDEAIPYALSAANAAAEYRRQGQAGGGYRGRIDIPVQSREDYLAVGQALTKAARAAGQKIDYGMSDGVMSVFSDTMNSDELDEFIDDVLDQGLAEGGFDIPEIPRAPQPRPDPKNKMSEQEKEKAYMQPDQGAVPPKTATNKPMDVKPAEEPKTKKDPKDYLIKSEQVQQYTPKGVPLPIKQPTQPAPLNVPQGWEAKTQPDGSTRISKIGSMSREQYRKNMADYAAKYDSPEYIKYHQDKMASGGFSDEEKLANYKEQEKYFGRGDPEILNTLKQPVQEAGPFSYGAKKPRKGSVNESIEQYLEELSRAGYGVITETAELCPECGGPAFSNQLLAEKKDACYSKVKSRYKVWPSAYASGALVRCRKVGAKNWGNKSKK